MTAARGRIGIGLVGPGFVGAHHIDAVRGSGSSMSSRSPRAARSRRAEGRGSRRAEGLRQLRSAVAIPTVARRPQHDAELSPRAVIMAALAHREHVISNKPLAMTATRRERCSTRRTRAACVHAVTYNYRGNPLVRPARAMMPAANWGRCTSSTAAISGLAARPDDFSSRLEPDKGGANSAIRTSRGTRATSCSTSPSEITEVLADLHDGRRRGYKPSASRRDPEAISPPSRRPGSSTATDATATTKRDLATVFVRFATAQGCVTVGQVCAGHKNDLWFEVNGAKASLRWYQERQNEFWIGHRHAPNQVLLKDPSLLGPRPARMRICQGGHQEAWSDAFRNLIADVYASIAGRSERTGPTDAPDRPSFPTFEDGYRAACLVDSILDSHRRGGVWIPVNTRAEIATT